MRRFALLAVLFIALSTSIASADGGQAPPGWYAPGGTAQRIADVEGVVSVDWTLSYIYPHPGPANLYWYAEVAYVNHSSDRQATVYCDAGTDPPGENMRGTRNAGVVRTDDSICTRNPSYSQPLGPGHTQRSWAIFHNVPWNDPTSEIQLLWPPIGQSPWVKPWVLPVFGPPPPKPWPRELCNFNLCPPGSEPTSASSAAKWREASSGVAGNAGGGAMPTVRVNRRP